MNTVLESMPTYQCGQKSYEYGDRANQIDPFFEKKREWSHVKDRILGAYVVSYLRTIQRLGRPIIIVDSFAGPGMFGDGAEGSPMILCKAIQENAQGSVGIGCIFSDIHPAHREALESNIQAHISRGLALKPLTNFTESLTRALEVGKARNATLFFYLDPYGVKDLEFETVKQIYERNPQQSTEVLINFNFKAFMRMSGNWKFNDSTDDISRKVKASKVERINSVMGGDYWMGIITDPKIDKLKREDLVVAAYMNLVRKYFDYTYSIPVKEMEDSDGSIPTDELAKYHLIFGTRHPRAVRYMNDVANGALEQYLNQFREGLLFSFVPQRFQAASSDAVKDALVAAVAKQQIKRPELYEQVVPQFFLHYRTKEYRAMIDDLIKAQRLFPNPKTIKQKGKMNDETLLSVTPWT